MITKIERRIKIKYRVRNKISGTPERPRMSVFRSNKQIYVQLVDDTVGKTLAAASSLGMEAMPKKEQAAKVGALIAKKAQEAGITTVVFDRNGYLYHGRVKEVADAKAREIQMVYDAIKKSDPDENSRLTRLTFTMRPGTYRSEEEYRLVIRNDTDIPQEIPFKINISFSDDFGF